MSSLPWYKWYASDWFRCETRFKLSLAERGMYRDLLDIHYLEGSIPKSEKMLAALIGAQHEEFEQCWQNVSRFFENHPTNPERLVNKRAIAVLRESRKYQKTQQLNGSKGGRPKKAKENPRVSESQAKAKPSESESESELTPYDPSDHNPPLVVLGQAGRVRVTHEEHVRLVADIGPHLDYWIEKFDNWVDEAPDAKTGTGKKRKDRDANKTIRKWHRDAVADNKLPKVTHGHSQDQNTDAIAEALRRRAERRAGGEVAPLLRGVVSDVRQDGDPGEGGSLVRTALGHEPF